MKKKIAIISAIILSLVFMWAAIGTTYALRPEKPEHVLTYSNHTLKWDSDTITRDDGSVELNVFDRTYTNVESKDKVLAPGTEGRCIIRIDNKERDVSYKVKVTYEGILPINVSLQSGERIVDMVEDKVVEMEGVFKENELTDIDIVWSWDFEGDDILDTNLGNEAKETAVVRFEITVVEDEAEVLPSPQTGDNMLAIYIIILSLSGTFLIYLFLTRKKYNDKEEKKVNQ